MNTSSNLYSVCEECGEWHKDSELTRVTIAVVANGRTEAMTLRRCANCGSGNLTSVELGIEEVFYLNI